MDGRMWDSSEGMKEFMAMIATKYVQVPPRYAKKFGQPELSALQKANRDAFIAVSQRFKKGDFRHTSMELGKIAEFAQWLVNLHAATNGDTPRAITVVEAEMVRQTTAKG